jgi:hypothetical protein
MRRSAIYLELLLILGCTSEGSIGRVREYVEADSLKLDVLFVVDDSASMHDDQQKYLPILIRQLEALPGGLPSLHVGVVSTDMGIFPFNAEQCEWHGRAGALQNAPQIEGCTPPEGAFIADELDALGGRVRNYSGSLEDTFMCIATIGGGGCGIEQPLAAMRAALDGSISKNVGFLRDDAFLAVVFLGDEDDCSTADPWVFNPAAELDSPTSPLGPFSSFRCTRFGLTCSGGPPTAPGTYSDCEPREDSYIAHTDTFVDFLTSIKDPSATLVTVVAGAPRPVVAGSSSSGATTLLPSCTGELGVADPAVRLAHFAASFPNHQLSSICDGDQAKAVFSLGGDVRALITTYERDRRDDLDISYGCQAGKGAGGAAALLVLLLAVTCTRACTGRSRRRSSSARSG